MDTFTQKTEVMIRRTATLLLFASVMAIPATTLAQEERRGRSESESRGQQERAQRTNTGYERSRSTRSEEVRRDPSSQSATPTSSTSRAEQFQRGRGSNTSQPTTTQPDRRDVTTTSSSRAEQFQQRDRGTTTTSRTEQPQSRPTETSRTTTSGRYTRPDGNVTNGRGDGRPTETSGWQTRPTETRTRDSRWEDRGNSSGCGYSRYEGRYEGRWDHRSYEDRFRKYGYGRPKYVYYHSYRIYRAPYYSGVIRVRPPYYRGMPRIIYSDYRDSRDVVLYRPIWAPDYVFVRRFIFFPRLNLYWDNYSNAFVYLRGSRWISSIRLPGMYVNINLGTEPMFEVEEDYDSEDGFYDDGSYYYEY